ncbi:CLUMA_CG003784, isoform A [Clunio marinus]|uniref:CLUMA_CG003784, isoform A n=1 Tax=Clunio marinus TaxID=568069 RepID=A0A1J1HV80_9DIPT|nr:CLUMA_CG003784, isoform A [Clunio marinus]
MNGNGYRYKATETSTMFNLISTYIADHVISIEQEKNSQKRVLSYQTTNTFKPSSNYITSLFKFCLSVQFCCYLIRGRLNSFVKN